MIFAISVALSAIVADSSAASPSFSCKRAVTAVQRMICNDDALAALDRKLADVYGIAAKTPSHYDDLNLRQRNWVRARDNCWQDTDFRACIEHAYVYRIAELQTRYKLVTAKGPVRYACPGMQPEELTATFFQTEPASVVLDNGGTLVLALLNGASGTPRYEAGRVRFREQGSDAILVWGDPKKEIPCTKTK